MLSADIKSKIDKIRQSKYIFMKALFFIKILFND